MWHMRLLMASAVSADLIKLIKWTTLSSVLKLKSSPLPNKIFLMIFTQMTEKPLITNAEIINLVIWQTKLINDAA